MFTRGLSKQTQINLEALGKLEFVSKYYLGGGTALSLQLGHRFSHDLDFFAKVAAPPEVIIARVKELGTLEVFQNDYRTFNGSLNGVKLSFFEYPYNMINDPVNFQGVDIASIIDIGCIKLDAISSRGKKRDFIDLFFILRSQTKLPDLFRALDNKYAGVTLNKLHIFKSLVYFEDAETDEMPQMLEKLEWSDVKLFFEAEVRRLSLGGSVTLT